MDKLIIACCVWDERPHWPVEATVNMPRTIKEIVASVHQVRDAGAAIAHIHQPGIIGAQGEFILKDYLELTRLVRETDVVYEHRGPGPHSCQFAGRNGIDAKEWVAKLKEWRKVDLGDDKPDMVNCIVGPQHIDFGKINHYVMPTLEELEAHMLNCRKMGVKAYFEVFGIASLYNLRWLIERKLIDAPYWLELNMGWKGSTYTPATPEALVAVTKALPEGSQWRVGGVGAPPKGELTPQQALLFLTQAIAMGGHVRVGFEDCPYYWDGTPAKSNGQLVESIVRIARAVGREIATPDETRQILGLPKRKTAKK